MDKLQQLDDRLEAGLQGHFSAWEALPKNTLMMLSREITAVRDAYDYLTRPHNFTEAEVDYLLSLPDPLQTAADKWKERIGDMSDFCFAMDEVFKEAKVPRKEADKPSVLDGLREKTTQAAKRPAIPKIMGRGAR